MINEPNLIEAQVAEVRSVIERASVRAGRDPGEVRLIAVSKGAPVEVIRQAMAAGVTDFGENRAGEAVDKHDAVGAEVTWHFIGRIQRNKVKKISGFVDVIHSVDRLEVGEEISRRASRLVKVLIEVSVSGEPSKGGVHPTDVARLIEDLLPLPNVQVIGLMTMAPLAKQPEDSRPHFRRLAELAVGLRRRFPEAPIHHLSMGMSQDYEVAVEEGSTMVRVGRAIFDPRLEAAERGSDYK